MIDYCQFVDVGVGLKQIRNVCIYNCNVAYTIVKFMFTIVMFVFTIVIFVFALVMFLFTIVIFKIYNRRHLPRIGHYSFYNT